jgi:hypothetical protein
MTTSVFPLYKNTYTLPAYFAVVLLLSSLCFGNLKDHLYFTHDDEIQQDYPHLNADPAFFFSPDKDTASVRPIDELVMWAAYAAWGNNPAFFHLLDTHNAEAVKYIAFLLFTTTRAFHLLVVAAHTLAAWLLARVVWRQGGSLILAGATGLLFWVNGTHFQAVHHHLRARLPVGALLRTNRPTRAWARSRDQTPHHPYRIVSLRHLGAPIDSRRLAAHILPDLATRQ